MAVKSGEAENPLYPYTPNKAAAYVYVALFAITAIIHTIMMFPFRAAFFIPLIIGLGMEAGSYYFRSVSSDNTRLILPTVLNGLLNLGAPPFIAATIYMILGRIMRVLKAEIFSPISPRWLTKLFVLGDILCLASQMMGSILSASDKADERERGRTIVLAGLIFQFVIFCLFILLTLAFEIRYRRSGADTYLRWKMHTKVLYALSVIFLVRNLVRIIEYLQGDGGFIISHEAMLYALDATPMLFMGVILLIVHPGKLFKAARRGEKEQRDDNGNEMAPMIRIHGAQ
ncbi:RTA1 like protein-domain-containing protein [Bisporella sp. PMI_857]|nr:RTA1 like protein-domain-containing protein [Bisporella sp. PMI_857]